MGLLSGLLGNASEVDAGKLQTEFAQVLAPGEKVEKAYQRQDGSTNVLPSWAALED
jgi:hypothetical protein